ncbi:MAG: hypothetical protein HON02_04020, partial [Rhodospirillaceae bacterium]|nr:hypothetical protein [Rhodospirillaceae bacterium]
METLSLIVAIAALAIVVVVIAFMRAEKANGRVASDKLAELTGRMAQMGE